MTFIILILHVSVFCTKMHQLYSEASYTVKPVHTGMPWDQSFIPVWTGFSLDRVFAFGEEHATIICTIDMCRR